MNTYLQNLDKYPLLNAPVSWIHAIGNMSKHRYHCTFQAYLDNDIDTLRDDISHLTTEHRDKCRRAFEALGYAYPDK